MKSVWFEIHQQNQISYEINQQTIGTFETVLVEGPSKKSPLEWQGRSDTNKTVIFPQNENLAYIVGDYIKVQIARATSATLMGTVV